MNRVLRDRRRPPGQATLEMVIILPVLGVFIAGAMGLIYIGYQSLKVQEAANLAARIQGQERVAGAVSLDAIDETNLGGSRGDQDPRDRDAASLAGAGSGNADELSVFGRWYTLVKENFFKGSEQDVYIPAPEIGQNVDKVSVSRKVTLRMPFVGERHVVVTGEAYGGEDTHMYALPRWGESQGGTGLEWKSMIKDCSNGC